MRQPLQLSCCIEAPAAYLPKARYAVEMLLQPLAIDPVWTPRQDVDRGLYYGPDADGLGDAVVAFELDPAVPTFFEQRSAVTPDDVFWVEWEGEVWPVPVGGQSPDLMASTFFWLSGWQEVTTAERDQHGRFPFDASLQHALDIAARPPVEAYRALVAERLQRAGVPVQRRRWGAADWVLCPTHDIDYLRKWRPGILYREVVPYLFRNHLGHPFGQRLRRLLGVGKEIALFRDPQRASFERMHDEVRKRGGTATYFLKTGAHGPRDVYYHPQDRYLSERVKALQSDGYEIGLHPSYHAHTHADYLAAERERMAVLTDERPTSIRQHYLRYDLPATARLQAAAGFRVDASLGFAEHEGFRHGTCLPFRLYDVQANASLELWEMPLAVMESALFNRRHLSFEEAVSATGRVMRACQRFGGAAVMLWHNVLWDERDYPDWGAHFLDTLDAAVASGAPLCSLQDALARWDPRILKQLATPT